MNPCHLYKAYLNVVSENHDSETLPFKEKVIHFVLPIVTGGVFAFYFKQNVIDDKTINLLLTVHGILVSVLMASFTPFIEKIDKAKVDLSQLAQDQIDYNKSAKIAQKLVFSSNALSIFLSLIIIIFLILEPAEKGIVLRDAIISESIKFQYSPILFLLHWIIFSLMILNVILVVRTVHLLSDIVLNKLNE